MNCKFCASGLLGLKRNLTANEIMAQVLAAKWELQDEVTHIVIMGTGEPLLNINAVGEFIKRLKISPRRITLSTCGIVPEIKRLHELGVPVNLAISLHAPNDIIRREIMPIANKYSIIETLGAVRYYIETTGRRAIIEYALIDKINSRPEHADELAARLRGMQCHVNLIPLNAVKERDMNPPAPAIVRAFLARLESHGISTTIRREMGSDINGACGQLRRSVLLEER
jgi:23S rRNA (adenine2503-C2)-methyltransferase